MDYMASYVRLYFNEQKTVAMSSEVNTVIPNFNMKPVIHYELVIPFKESHLAYSEKDFEARKAPVSNSSNRLEKMQRSNLSSPLKKNFFTSKEFFHVRSVLKHG